MSTSRPQLQVISLPRRPDNAYDMVLGMDFLLAHRMLIAVSQDRLHFSYLGGEVFSSAKHW